MRAEVPAAHLGPSPTPTTRSGVYGAGRENFSIAVSLPFVPRSNAAFSSTETTS